MVCHKTHPAELHSGIQERGRAMINPQLLGVLPVSAYIDPGTLTLIVQVLITRAIGGLFLIKGFGGRVKTFLVGLFRRNKKDND